MKTKFPGNRVGLVPPILNNREKKSNNPNPRDFGGIIGVPGGSYSRCPPSYQDAMSLQWTVVATFLYAEVFLVLLLCVPFVSPTR